MSNPTARARAPLRELGYTAKVVEHWNPYAKIRPDLLGVDILALKPGEPVLAVQCTSASNHSARRGKLQDDDHKAQAPRVTGHGYPCGWLEKASNFHDRFSGESAVKPVEITGEIMTAKARVQTHRAKLKADQFSMDCTKKRALSDKLHHSARENSKILHQ